MALKFGPQWLRDLSDTGGSSLSPQPPSSTGGFKFKLAEYRYGREEMLSLFNDNNPPPDQVCKHQSVFSKDIQKPVTMSPLSEDEQRLVSQGFNCPVVLRAAGRGGPPTNHSRLSRGGGTLDRGRGRGRGHGEGYISRTLENGDIGYSRSTQDGWEQVGRKYERNFSRSYEDSGPTKREFNRASNDNWRDKRHEEEEEEESGSWRNSRWGAPSARTNWRESQRDSGGYDNDRKPLLSRRGFDQDLREPRKTSESIENESEVPEWVEDGIEDDPGTFDSKGVFVSTKESKGRSSRDEYPTKDSKKQSLNSGGTDEDPSNGDPEAGQENSCRMQLSRGHKPHNGMGYAKGGTHHTGDPVAPQQLLVNEKGRPDSIDVQSLPHATEYLNKGDGDSGFAYPNKDINGTRAPPGQFSTHRGEGGTPPHPPESVNMSHPKPKVPDVPQQKIPRQTGGGTVSEVESVLHVERSLQNLVAEMVAEKEHKSREEVMNPPQSALPLTHEDAFRWFYKDPQGEVQGPFSNDDMSEWFSAGYFTMSLVIKRGCDDSFKQLGELIKLYSRVPFLPGPPLPPLVTSSSMSFDLPPMSTGAMPQLISPLADGPSRISPSPIPTTHDPLVIQQMLLHQEYLKQAFLMRQMQVQTLNQLQEQEAFKTINPTQQQHLAMQMITQANPLFMQQFHQLQQQQQLLLQQHQQHQQQKQSEIQKSTPSSVPSEGLNPLIFPSIPSMSATNTTPVCSVASSEAEAVSSEERSSSWDRVQSPSNPSTGESWMTQQPSSLWDISGEESGLSPAYQAQLEKMKKERDEREEADCLKDERLRQDKKEQDIRRQQEDLERQREQMRREKGELERQREHQKLLEHQKQEAVRREEQRILQEIKLQKQEQEVEERRRQEQEEEERKREKEQKKVEEKEQKKREEKRRKEEAKKKQQEEMKKHQGEMRKRQQEDLLQQEQELLREQQELQRQEEARLLEQKQREEMERMKREEEAESDRVRNEEIDRERMEAQRRQQSELQRQQESLRRLQQAQREQLANMQLPASSNWAAQQSYQASPVQSKSLTEIQEEEACREQEREYQMQQEQEEHAFQVNYQNHQKSWATHTSNHIPSQSPLSLLDIQQQEQEISRKTGSKDTSSYQAKLSLASGSTWTGSGWGNQGMWDTSNVGSQSSSLGGGIWDQQPTITSNKKTTVKEGGEFPALRTQSSQPNKIGIKNNKTKTPKHKKDEESVQKLFQTGRQDNFTKWITEKVSSFPAEIDVPTFVAFIVDVDSPDDIKDYMKTYLGDTKQSQDFACQFIEKRNSSRNQARLEKQQEEDSIWGPAPAVNPYNPVRGTIGSGGGNTLSNLLDDPDGFLGVSGKSKNRKKKQKMQKLDVSELGFTVHSDPNRKNAGGELESVHQ